MRLAGYPEPDTLLASFGTGGRKCVGCYNETMAEYTLPVVIEKDEDGYYAECPSLQGCYAQGASYEEVLANLSDAIKLNIEDRRANGESLEFADFISVATLKVSA